MQNFSFAHFRVGRGVYRLCSIFLYVYGCLCCWLWLEDDCARACDCALTLTFLGFVKFVSALLASCVASDVPSVRDRFLRWFVVDILQLWTPRLFCCVIWIEILKSGNLGQFFPYRRVLLSCVEYCRLVLFSVVYCVLRICLLIIGSAFCGGPAGETNFKMYLPACDICIFYFETLIAPLFSSGGSDK